MDNPILQLHHVTYHYPGAKQLAVNDVNLSLNRGEWLTLIGLNGSGKSTLVKLIDGLVPKTSGQIVVDHQLLTSKSLLKIRPKIGVVFQNPKDQFVGVTVKDEVAFGLENQQVAPDKIKHAVRKSLSLVGMSSYYDSLVDNLSGGQQQRIAIADVIVLRPKIIILDECTSMLDPQGRDQIVRLVNALKHRFNLTIIDITHNISEAKYAQKIAVMNHGKIVASGTPNAIFQRSALFHKLHLGLPQPDTLRDLLKSQGIDIPNQHFNETRLLSWLHQLFLNG